ncbi:unnamed protein product [Caenorhabditis nigoni]
MSSVPQFEKGFVLKHVFEDVTSFEEEVRNYSKHEDHFNVNWCMIVRRRHNHLDFYFFCEPISPSDKWSIQTRAEFKVVGRSQNDVIETKDHCYEKAEGVGFEFLKWEEMENWFLVDGKLTVEAKVTILETTGLGTEKFREFDESQKGVSDVILEIRDTKFYVSKMFLASQSHVFKTLLLGNFSETNKSEMKLNGIDPNDFHYFLETLYGESIIDDANVEGVLLLADKFDAKTALKKCVEFLLEKSKKTLKKKQQMANRYHLGNWDSIRAISNVNTKTKQFILKHEFKDAHSFEEGRDYYSQREDHFNVNWYMSVRRRNNHLDFHFFCEPIASSDKWSIQTRIEFKVVGRNENDVMKTTDHCYEKVISKGFNVFLEWKEMENEYLEDGNLTVEAEVTIMETTGLGKEKIRKFDESQRAVSDVILVVRDTKFYLSKMYLAAQSSFFKALFDENSSDSMLFKALHFENSYGSKKSEVVLKNADPNDFHYFLEALHGESAIDDSDVEGVLLLADTFDAPTVKRKCVEFLLEKSEKSFETKLQMANRYHLGNRVLQSIYKDSIRAVLNASTETKQFILKHEFKDVHSFEEGKDYYSKWEDHFNVEWCMSVGRCNNHLSFGVRCQPIAPSNKWSIQTRIEFKVVGRNQNDVIKTKDYCYKRNGGIGFHHFLTWETLQNENLVDGKLTVEVSVTVIETTGLEQQKIRKFDESQKGVSDVILEIRDTKFYVSKMYLAAQSSFFYSLFFGNSSSSIVLNDILSENSSESEKPEVSLKGVDPNDFHNFMEVLYGESVIDDANVEGLLLLADKFDARTVKRRCVEFLREKSEKVLEKKRQMTNRNLWNWDLYCAIGNTKTKQFILKHEFKDVHSFEEGRDYYSQREDHFNVNWYMSVMRLNNHFAFRVYCEPIAPSDKWSIQTRIKFKVVGRNHNDAIQTVHHCYDKIESSGIDDFLIWEEMEKEYFADGKLIVEAKVAIVETKGLGKEKILKFDESEQDDYDCILVVRDTKFYVLETYLASHSVFFKAIVRHLSKEFVLNDVDPNDFHYFLEVLYGESAIDDSTVEGILMVADWYATPMATRRCQEFLLNSSKKIMRKKLQLSGKYGLGELKKKCMSEIQTIDDVKLIVSGGVNGFDQSIMSELLEKIPRFNNQ